MGEQHVGRRFMVEGQRQRCPPLAILDVRQFPAFGVFPEMQGILIFRFVNATGKMLTWTPQFIPQAKGLAGHGSLCQEGTCQEGTQESLR